MHEDGSWDRNRRGVHQIAALVDDRITHEGRLKGIAVSDHLPTLFVDLGMGSERMGQLAVEIGRTFCIEIGQTDHRRLRGLMQRIQRVVVIREGRIRQVL